MVVGMTTCGPRPAMGPDFGDRGLQDHMPAAMDHGVRISLNFCDGGQHDDMPAGMGQGGRISAMGSV
jgi:hypothetical protein